MGGWIFRGFLASVLVLFIAEGQGYSPGAALLPQLVAGATLFFVILDAIASLPKERIRKGKGEEREAGPPPGGRRFLESPRFYAAAACLFGFLLLFPWLGYLVTSILFVFLLSWSLGERRWHVLALCSLLAPILFQYTAEKYLRVVIPKGYLFEWLFPG